MKSPAREISKLSEDLTEAYAAVVDKGGTAPQDASLANLAAAIETVPGPEPPTPPTPPVGDIPYGKVGYYPWTSEWWASGDMCEVESINQAKLTAFFEEHPPMDAWIDLDYEPEYDEEWQPVGPGKWRYWASGEDMQFTTEELKTQMGITVTLEDELEWAMLMIEKSYNVDTTANLLYAEFGSEQALLDAGWPNDEIGGDFEHYVLTVGNAQVYNQAIKSYVFGSEVSEFPDYFLAYSYLMDTVDASGATITSVGGQFLGYSKFNSPIDMSHCTSIGRGFLLGNFEFNQPLDVSSATEMGGNFLMDCQKFNSALTLNPDLTGALDNFLYECYSFNQPLDIPTGITSIGSNFLYRCSAFNQPLTIPSGVTSIASYFMYYCRSFNQDLTIPENTVFLYSGGSYQLYGLEQMTSTVTLSTFTISKLGNNPESFLSVGSSSAPAYTQGIKVKIPSESASTFRSKVPDRTLSSPYRKLLLDGPTPTPTSTDYIVASGVTIALTQDDIAKLANTGTPTSSIVLSSGSVVKNTVTEVHIETKITSVGNSFCGNMPNLVKLDLPDSLVQVGRSLCYSCSSLNYPLPTSQFTKIDYGFLQGCSKFNQPVDVSHITNGSIPEGFMRNCSAFNSALTLPAKVTNVGPEFLYNDYHFNKPITLEVTGTIGAGFLSCAWTTADFNSDVTITGTCSSIDGDFLGQQYSFNATLTLPTTLRTIGYGFMRSCRAFNQPLILPSTVTSIGDKFFAYNKAYNSQLTLPSGLQSVGKYFMYACSAFDCGLDVRNIACDVFVQDGYSFAANYNTEHVYTVGFKLITSDQSGYLARFPEKDNATPYRKWNFVTS